MSANDRIYPTTRILAAVVIPFLALAVLILYFFPDQSAARFAWPVKPPLTARLMASAYAGGIYFFGSVLLARRWHTVKAGFLPVTVFASLLGIATVLHWDRFTPGHIAFILWAILYFTAPFLVLAAWLHNRREDPRDQATGPRFGRGWRVFFALEALNTFILSGALFLFPALLIPIWPWSLTPLTARVMAAMFAIPGVLGLVIFLDGRWSAARRLLEAQTLTFAMILAAVVLARTDISAGPAVHTGLVLAVAAILAALIGLLVHMRSRREKPVPSTASSGGGD